jgi:hypothetical protein
MGRRQRHCGCQGRVILSEDLWVSKLTARRCEIAPNTRIEALKHVDGAETGSARAGFIVASPPGVA